MFEARAADELAFRQADEQPARRDTAPARLDRPRATFKRQLAVDQADQVHTTGQVPDDCQPAMRRQAPIIRDDTQPSATSVNVTHAHPLGEPARPSHDLFSYHRS
jgi:hypothetical protein